MKTSRRASLIALAIASFPIGCHAAGLGQINVFSGLGQPLRAEIAVSATPQELQSLVAHIASPDAFKAANLPYSAAAASIRVSLDTRSGRPVIRLSSAKPINDPFVELLVELNWASGQLARGYTFLLDPVDVAAPKPAAARVEAAPAPVQPAPRMAPPPPPVAREIERAPASAPAPERYTVKRGDTLRGIAGSTAPAGANLDQMLIALFRANPGAFEGANINRLKAGAVLSVPSAERVQAVDPAEARREILAQATDFDAYRRRLAGAVGAPSEASEAAAEQASGGRIVPRVEEARPADEPKDKVRVSRSESPAGGDTNARLQVLEEELATREKALKDANERLAQLETSIRDLQKLLELRSASLAQAQQQAGGTRPEAAAAPAAPATPPAPAAGSPVPAGTVGVPAASSEIAKADVPPEVKPEPIPAPQPAPAPQAAPTPKPAPKKAQAAPPPPEEPGFIESLLQDSSTLAAGGGVAALLLALAGLKLRQRRDRNAAGTAETETAGTTQLPEQGAVFGETGGQSVDTGNSVLMTDFSQSGLSAIDTDEGVDPVAEADVYMAYGRDAQAEEILQDAMKADPDRAAIHLKLLEIYAQRKNVKQFEMVATELYARTGGRGADWERAAVMGRKLDPDNPLYGIQGAARTEGLAAPATEPSLAAAGLAAAAAVVATRADAGNPAGAPEIARKPETGPSVAASEAEAAVEAAAVESLSALDFTTSLPIEPSQSQLKETWTLPGDLGRFAKDEADRAEGAEAPVPDFTASAIEVPELDVIDFDLGLGEPDTAAVQAVAEQAVAGEADNADATGPGDQSLTFDLDNVDAPAVPAADAQAAKEAGALPDVQGDAVTASAFDFELSDFQLEPAEDAAPDLDATMLDAPPAAFEPETTALGMDFESAAETPNRIDAAPDLKATVISPEPPAFDPDATALDLDFELPDMSGIGSVVPPADRPPHPDAAASGEDLPETDLEKTSFDASLLDFDFDIEPQAQGAESAPAPSLDLTSIDLDLNSFGEADGLPAETPAGAQSPQPAAAADAPLPENFEEIETKLELARAYEEMGDKEGALELLEEVLREGGTRQQASAREMMDRLG
ncbi:FimV/HubP family polar landmark protein [Thauera sinica]|uniref:FimV/HubP family polar landmark protein n=1 Tax=Thauera sinica TaxID=2665146 RepID=A0ABW1AUG8_9RHOO|nr:FimV/HubP family polar landmark protein [Thauera sp. K11]ATE62464.1 pilus assembly protein [Thauera sp. K11]